MGTSSGGKSTCYTLLYGHSFDKKSFTGQSSSQRCICHPASLLVFCKTCKLFWAFPHLFARTLSGDSDVPSFQPVASIQVLLFRATLGYLGSMKHSGCSGCKICVSLPNPCRTCSNTSATSATSQFFSHQLPIRVMIHWSTHSFPFFWPFNVKGILRALTLAHLHTCGHLQKMLITSNYLFPDLCGAYVVERVAPKGCVAKPHASTSLKAPSGTPVQVDASNKNVFKNSTWFLHLYHANFEALQFQIY